MRRSSDNTQGDRVKHAQGSQDAPDLNELSLAALRLTYPDLVVEPAPLGQKGRRVVRAAAGGEVLGWISD